MPRRRIGTTVRGFEGASWEGSGADDAPKLRAALWKVRTADYEEATSNAAGVHEGAMRHWRPLICDDTDDP